MNEFDLNILNGHVLPPLPPYPKSAQVGIEPMRQYDDLSMMAPERVEVTQFGTPQAMPLKMKLSSAAGGFWLLPCEPLITIGGKNIIVKRNVAKSKMRGSIKERWAQDDYAITIQGVFTKQDTYDYPEDDLLKLRQLCEAKDTIDVLCPLFDVLKINRIVIENYDVPFTKGEENQNWSLTALSDDDWDLLLTIDNPGRNVL